MSVIVLNLIITRVNSASQIICHIKWTQYVRKPEYATHSINQKEKINKYREEVRQKLQEIQEIDEEIDINRDWQNLKQIILEAAKEFKIAKDGKNANHWWDDDCKRAVKEKNEVRKKCLIRKTRANLDLYHQKRNTSEQNLQEKEKRMVGRKNQTIKWNK